MAKKSSGHLRKGCLHQVEPGPMLGRVDIDETIGPGGQIRHGFFGDVGRMVVQNHPDDRLFWVMIVQALEKRNELLSRRKKFVRFSGFYLSTFLRKKMSRFSLKTSSGRSLVRPVFIPEVLRPLACPPW